MAFYTYNQNNSGGGNWDFDPDAGISAFVIVEANTPADADHKAESIGLYFDGCDSGRDCDCCGDRWYRAWSDGDAIPTVYGKDVFTASGERCVFAHYFPDDPQVFVHYADGTVRSAMTPAG